MNLLKDLKERAKSFISGKNYSVIQDKITSKVVTLVGIIPKRTIPRQLAETISKPLGDQEEDKDVNAIAPKKVISSLGKLTLDLIQVNDNLDKISKIIKEDYKSSQQETKKETEEYKKRIANRFRRIGGRELRNSKLDLGSIVKNYVGSFFKGVGGSIRALSAFNFLDSLMRGDVVGALKALLGMASTYIPAIVGAVVGGITGSILGGIRNLFRGAKPQSVPTAPTRQPTAQSPSKTPRFGGKLAKFLALGTSALALGSSFLKNPSDDETDRLEELTEQQKSLVSPENLVPIPENDLKKFENLNKKFEKAVDFLLSKQKEDSTWGMGNRQGGGGGSAPPPPPPQLPPPSGVKIQDQKQALQELGVSQEKFNAYKQGIADVEGARYNQMGGAGSRFAGRYQMGEQEIAAAARTIGMDPPSRQEFLSNPELQEKIFMGHTINVHRMMMSMSPRYAAMNPDQRFKVLAGSQIGVGNLTKYLETGKIPTDSANTSILKWIRAVEKRFNEQSQSITPRSTSNDQSSVSQLKTTTSDLIATAPQKREILPPKRSSSPKLIQLPVNNNITKTPQLSAPESLIDNVPEFNTAYNENFLTMYSKSIYQIV